MPAASLDADSPADSYPLAPARRRLDVLDALRGIALCGILLVNMPHMGWLVDGSAPHPSVREGGAAATAWWIQLLLVEGTMRGLFSLLFGAGILLFLAKAERGETTHGRARVLMLRRLFWLFVFGVVNGTLLLWPGDILIIYAMAGVFILPLWRAPARALGLAAGAIVVVLSAWLMISQLPARAVLTDGPRLEAQAGSGRPLTAAQQKTLEEWRHVVAGRPDAAADIERERAARLGGYGDNLAFMADISWGWFWDISTLRWVLDAAALMLVGMLFFRLGWLQGNASPRTYAALILIGYGIGVSLKGFETFIQWRNLTGAGVPSFWQLLVSAATFQPARLLVTLGHLGLFHLAWRSFPRIFRPFRMLGQMAFTCYLLQSVLAALAFSGFGLALWGRLGYAELWLAAAAIWAIEIAFAWLWLTRFGIGPLEWVWRTLTYGRAPPLRRALAAS